jgi:hypothetical protein
MEKIKTNVKKTVIVKTVVTEKQQGKSCTLKGDDPKWITI